MLLRGTDELGSDVTPAESSACVHDPPGMKDHDKPATSAGGDYKAFAAVRK
jgi:hypothetical protein